MRHYFSGSDALQDELAGLELIWVVVTIPKPILLTGYVAVSR